MGVNRIRKQVNLTLDPETHFILNKFKHQNKNRSYFIDEITSFWLSKQKFSVPDENIGWVTLTSYGPVYSWTTDCGDMISPEFRFIPEAVKWLESKYKIELK